MKLFVIATLISVSAAARLEHLEQQQGLRAYLPPRQSSGFGSSNGFDASRRPFGDTTGTHGTAGSNQPGFNKHASFPGASDRYLPPDHSAAGSVGVPQFAGSTNGLGAQGISSQYGRKNTFVAPSRFQPQSNSVNRQHLAPHSSQNTPQQAFDEETGYHY